MTKPAPTPNDGDKTPRPARRRASRQERTRRVAAVIVVTALAATAAGVTLYRAGRPDIRRPGEDLEDITTKLAKDLPENAPMPRFTDVTAEAGLSDFKTYVGSRSSQLPEDMGAGLAWGDYDNDGDDDLFLVGAGGTLNGSERAPSLLYENRDGSFQVNDGFPSTRIMGMAAAWGDYDGDGWLDLVVTGYESLLLFRNREGRLERDESFTAPDGYWSGAVWADFDNDRDLDLYVCGYVQYVEDDATDRKVSDQYGAAVPYTLNPASFEPERNLLFQNDGAGTFSEVALFYGVSNPEGRSLGALWHDFDDDGRLDLYVANDISDNALYLNRGDTFEDAGLKAWVADYRGAMGLAAGDWNRDGDDDLFVTHWIAQENALYDSRLADLRRGSAPQDAIQLSFSDLAAPLGLGQIALQSVGWGTEFADFDGDGWLDLVVANGSTLETDTDPKGLKPQPAMLLWNRAGKSFHDLAPLADVFASPHVSRGLAASDYDGDGDLDLAVYDLGAGVRLLRNDMQEGHWLAVRLKNRTAGGEARGFGDGTTLIAHTGGAELRRTLSRASYLSQSSRTIHFGLGEATRVERLEVRWLCGEPQVFEHLEADTLYELTEGEPTPRRLGRTATTAEPPTPEDERARLLEFWNKQRAAMDAMKRDGDVVRALGLFREALELNPQHEDSRYYLANCLAAVGRGDEALAELDRLRRDSPLSHRANKQWGVLRAVSATSAADLDAAQAALERALEINPEETGTLLVLGEIALLRDEEELAEQRFEWACRTNPQAVGGFFLRAYIAWKRGDGTTASELLTTAHKARGEEWKPEGTVAEGDVAQRMHREETPLASYWEGWDGTPEASTAFRSLNSYLSSKPFAR